MCVCLCVYVDKHLCISVCMYVFVCIICVHTYTVFILFDTKTNIGCICYQMSYLVLTNNGDDKLNDLDIHSGW